MSADSPPTAALLDAALRSAPRRYRMPPLPGDAAAARAAGAATALAFALEALREPTAEGRAPADGLRAFFTAALGTLIREALATDGGEPDFQAQVLRAQDETVDAYVGLAAQAAHDARALRTAVNAIEHPGKLRQMLPGAMREWLANLHALATAQAWGELRQTLAQELAGERRGDAALHEALARLLSHPALARLEQRAALHAHDGVRRYRALLAQRGPLATSDAATAQGRASARAGAEAEAGTVDAFARIAQALNRAAPAGPPYRAVHGLRNPPVLPAGDKTKGEWDVLLVRGREADAAELVLLAEVKASPTAAAPDLPRLLRGLAAVAAADAHTHYAFRSARGEVRIRGDSLRRLQPNGRALPPHAIYCCAAVEEKVGMLSAASKAVLMAEPASLAFGMRITRGESPSSDALHPVWQALHTPRLRTALHQYATACAVRDAMLHPDDLVLAVAQALDGCGSGQATSR